MRRSGVDSVVDDLTDVFRSVDFLDEGRALPIGTVRKWGDGFQYKKISALKWQRVVDGKKTAAPDIKSRRPTSSGPSSKAVEVPKKPITRRTAPTIQVKPTAHSRSSEREANVELRYTEFDTPPEGEWVDKAPGLPEDTTVVHFDGGSRPKAYRAVVHEHIISRAVSSVPAPEADERPHVIITMGVPASGKSTYRSRIAQERYVIADADRAKVQLPEFQEARAKRARNAAMIVHKESGFINDQIIDQAFMHKKHLIIDGVGSNPDWYREQMRQFKAQGYYVSLIMTHLDDVEEAVKRGKERGERDGRFVVEDYQRAMFDSLPKNFLKLMPEADHAAVFDTSHPNTFRLAFEKNEKGSKTYRSRFMKRHFAEQAEAAIPALREMFALNENDRRIVDVSEVMGDLVRAAKLHFDALTKLPKKFHEGQGFVWPADDVTGEFYRPRKKNG